MPIRQIDEGDIPSLTRIAQRGLEFDTINEALLREKTIGARNNDPELGLLYEHEGRITAFAQGVLGGELDGKKKGIVRIFCVDRAFRRHRHADKLFDEVEGRLKAKGAEILTIMDSPANYLTPGIDFRYTETYCFLLHRGYTVFRENHNMVCDLDVELWPELDEQVRKLEATGMEVGRARAAELPLIIEFLEKEWKGWIPEVTSAMENEPAGVFICRMNGLPVAFAAYQGNNKSLPFFGPMGTSPVLRGRGAGAILLRLCLRELAQQGWNYAIIPWVGPVAFYAKFCNARLDRCFWAYKKEA